MEKHTTLVIKRPQHFITGTLIGTIFVGSCIALFKLIRKVPFRMATLLYCMIGIFVIFSCKRIFIFLRYFYCSQEFVISDEGINWAGERYFWKNIKSITLIEEGNNDVNGKFVKELTFLGIELKTLENALPMENKDFHIEVLENQRASIDFKKTVELGFENFSTQEKIKILTYIGHHTSLNRKLRIKRTEKNN